MSGSSAATGQPAQRRGARIESSGQSAKPAALAVGLSTTDFLSTSVAGTGSLQTETLVLNEPAGTTAFVMLKPFQFGTTNAVVVAVVRISAPRSSGGAAWTDHQKLCAAISGQLSGGVAARVPAEIAGWPGLAPAQAALATGSGQRSALIFTAGEAGVPVAVDVALVADDSVVATICNSIVKDLKSSRTSPDSAALAWIIEKNTYEAMLDLLNNEKVPPELSGLLSAYAGEAGRQSASLAEVMRDAASPADMDARAGA